MSEYKVIYGTGEHNENWIGKGDAKLGVAEAVAELNSLSAKCLKLEAQRDARDADLLALQEAVAGINEKCDHYLCSAGLPVPDSIHVEGLKSGIEEIKKIAAKVHKSN